MIVTAHLVRGDIHTGNAIIECSSWVIVEQWQDRDIDIAKHVIANASRATGHEDQLLRNCLQEFALDPSVKKKKR
jgi:hypothetical protein